MARKPDTPCAGGCGRLLWGTSTSLPPGERVCQRCRRARKNAEPDEARPEACGYCAEPFTSKRRGVGLWSWCCSRTCARRLRIAEGDDPFMVAAALRRETR
ncbi:hypothetical protein Gobs01_01902 [Geodermatophilus obscurus DSM 43160]|uniref:Uncharacterized protein n=1 Tax=Geodermatophilus obscurus (strain ATCC 25078 / DSM 43160 / JCM 3152 / CCUG 61914 / KCC A-0152 / KCTC 9177 / NBRC 13315 / NRRL B-3577 / G-20) TaxID=526225 RepID=D2SBQ6_GEOOG|nr:hypothetical protein Gobs_3575 [Geodermatophilus obscurus DSM 43160]